MKRWIFSSVAVIALFVVAAGTASAQGYGGIGYGCGAPYGGISYSAGYSPGIGYTGGGYGAGLSISGYGGGYGPGINFSYGGYPRVHQQPHLDYHPPTVRRHWGHLDVVPGHYDLHRSHHHH